MESSSFQYLFNIAVLEIAVWRLAAASESRRFPVKLPRTLECDRILKSGLRWCPKVHNADWHCISAFLRPSSQKRNRSPNAPPKSQASAFLHAIYERAE
jgi:hypothetical protein